MIKNLTITALGMLTAFSLYSAVSRAEYYALRAAELEELISLQHQSVETSSQELNCCQWKLQRFDNLQTSWGCENFQEFVDWQLGRKNNRED